MRVRRLPFNGQFTVLAACDNRGACTLLQFLEGLGANLQKDSDHMLELLERVASSGPPRNTEICHKIEGEIWEFIKGRLRVLWFYDAGKVVVCTHGLVKSSQKLPRAEIARAQQIKEDYDLAGEHGNLVIEED